MANGHGGARPGAGRKRIADEHKPAVDTFHAAAAAYMPAAFDNLQMLADGGFEQITETWEPAGLIYAEETDFDAQGKAVKRRVKAFPELPAEQLVCVRRTRSIAAPDRKANEYLVDRVAGRPVAAVEVDGELGAGDTLVELFKGQVVKIYSTGGES